MKVVIIGGVASGASAAARLRRNDENAEIIMLEKGNYISYANCGLPYYIGSTIKDRKKLFVQTPASMMNRFAIDIRVNNEAIKIDPDHKEVSILDSLSNTTYSETYDKLLIATGASPLIPVIDGIDSPQVFTVRSVPDTDAIVAHVKNQNLKSAVIIGGGFIGIEMMENLSQLGLSVTIVEQTGQIMSMLDFEMAQILHQYVNKKGIKLCLNQQVTKIEAGPQPHLQLNNQSSIAADIVILAAGIRPNSELAIDSGINVDERGYILTNEYLQTSIADIYAAGDVIAVNDRISGNNTAYPLAGPANKQGRIVADHMCKMESSYRGALGSMVAKIFDLTAASTGNNENTLIQAGKKAGKDYLCLYSHPQNHAAYYPGGTEIHMKLIFSLPDGKILGAQAIGKEGTEKRIDVIATAMNFGAKVTDLTELELTYAPPYNTAKDGVNMLGYMGENILQDKVKIIQWAELKSEDLEKYQILDVRTPQEVAEGKVPGSIHVPLDQIRNNMDQLDRSKTIAVYCKAGLRSYIACRILLQNGFEVRNIPGGWTTYCFGDYKPE